VLVGLLGGSVCYASRRGKGVRLPGGVFVMCRGGGEMFFHVSLTGRTDRTNLDRRGYFLLSQFSGKGGGESFL